MKDVLVQTIVLVKKGVGHSAINSRTISGYQLDMNGLTALDCRHRPCFTWLIQNGKCTYFKTAIDFGSLV